MRITRSCMGSLIWDGSLNIVEDFMPRGPLLPVEFCRVSRGGRLTLAIDEAFGAPCSTYIAMSACSDLNAAMDNLWIREGSHDEVLPKNVRTHGRVGFVEVAPGFCSAKAMERHPNSVATLMTWAQANGSMRRYGRRPPAISMSPTKWASRFRLQPPSAISKPSMRKTSSPPYEQDAREVRTKHAKTFTTWFFPVGDDIRQIVIAWIEFLREQKGFGLDDPLFPKTKVANGDDLLFRAVSIDREPWSNANPVRGIFREACGRAGLPYFNPHSLRNTLVQIAYEQRLDAEAFKAWSQNLGHESCLTTFSSYGTLPPGRQAEIMRQLAAPRSANEPNAPGEVLKWMADFARRNGTKG